MLRPYWLEYCWKLVWKPLTTLIPSLWPRHFYQRRMAKLSLLALILPLAGYVYAIAGTGAETLHLWQEKHPRVILLDTTLPDMTGEDVIREIRIHEQTAQVHVPVIGVLARPMEGDREACRHAGMDDTLLKPLSPDMVGSAIRRFLSDAQAVQVKGT